MKSSLSNTALLKWFIKEEFRLFETLFGSKRLMMFPMVLLTLSIAMGAAIPVFSISTQLFTGVLVVLVALFGLQTGSLGFEARDTLDDLMGDSSRILFSSRTLPISTRRLAGIFLLKDAIVYSVFMLLPIFIGASVGLIFSPFASSIVIPSMTAVAGTYILVMLSFLLGVSVGFTLTSVELRRVQGIIGSIVTGAVVLISSYFTYQNIDIILELGYLPIYGVLLLGIILFTSVGLWQFNISSGTQKSSKHKNRYKSFYSQLGDSIEGKIVSKTIIDVLRSPGGIWKLFFSTGVISLTVVFLVEVIKEFMFTGVDPSFLYASLFSLSVFPVYTLIYRYDTDDYYSTYPMVDSQVRRAKSIAYVVLSMAVVGVYYTISSALYQVSLPSYLSGGVIILSLVVYQLGIFLFVAKDEPLKFLFNGMMFSGYSVSLLVVLIPLTMVGLFGSVLPQTVTYFGFGVCGFCLVVGSVMSRVAINRDSK